MPAISASAPGKAILFGEHSVVYNRPAIAVPVTEVAAHAVTLFSHEPILIEAPGIQLFASLDSLPKDHPFSVLFTTIQKSLNLDHFPTFKLIITSTLPIAAGLGSGAAVSIAAARAITTYLGYSLSDGQISDIAYEVEKLHHGTPSGIDNAAIAYAKPVYFVRDQPIQILNVAAPFSLLIADSGISSFTRDVVAGVRQRWTARPDLYESWFDQIAALTRSAKTIITAGNPADLGPLMVKNHAILQNMGVSVSLLDQLVETALDSGALGAKLCGAGGGGNMIALVSPDKVNLVADALREAGAVRVVLSHIKPALTILEV